MNSIEKITERITEEARVYAAEAIKKANERAAEIISEAEKNAEEIRLAYAERAEKESAAIILRAASSSDVLDRNILLDAKSVMIDEVFKKAVEAFAKTDTARYFDFLVKTLRSCIDFLSSSEEIEEEGYVEENTDLFVLTLSKDDKAAFGKKLISAVKGDISVQNKKMEISEKDGDFSHGLRVCLGNVEVNATLEALMKTAREKTESEVYGILFR